MIGRFQGRLRYLLMAILFVLGFWESPVWAQSGDTGGLTVTVSDPTGAPIKGATVKISNGGAISRADRTNDDGNITFAQLPPGSYRVSITADGFNSLNVS